MARGGKRDGAGRKAADGATDLGVVTVSIENADIDEAMARGDGNISLGLRAMLAERRAEKVKTISSEPQLKGALWRRPR